MTQSEWFLLYPWWLLALPPLGILLWRMSRISDNGLAHWRRVIDAHLLPHLIDGNQPRRRQPSGVAWLACGSVATVVALAGPAFQRESQTVYQPDMARVLVVDLAAQDMTPPRLEQLKLKILELLRTLPEGQTALLVYAGEPYLAAPLTTDVETIAHLVPELAPDIIPVAGNRPELAVRMARNILARSAATQRDLLWVTAGAGPAPSPSELAGLRLSVLHMTAADDPALAATARGSGGSYVRLQADNRDIRQLIAALSADRRWNTVTESSSGNKVDAGYWLLLPLLPLAALAFRAGILTLLAAPLLLALLSAPQPAAALDLSSPLADYRAWRLLQSGAAARAADGFSDPRWCAAASYRAGRYDRAAILLQQAHDADSLYNRGNALAMQGRLVEALAAYDAALKQHADKDTKYNRDLVQRLLNQSAGNSATGGARPPPVAAASLPAGDAEREAAAAAQQWLRRVPDAPEGLLRRKLLMEHRRRLAGGERSW
jgi:Ca-activated chloride channel family protein